MDNGTIKEICDVVTAEVMKQVSKNLSAIKPELIEQIKNSAQKAAVQEAQRIIDSKYNKHEKRIAQLEETIAQLTAKQTEPEQTKAERIPAKAVDGINTLSPTQIEDILSYTELYHEYKGWIYYIKKIARYTGELYKVKTDGTQNQKIFSGQVSASHPASSFGVFNDMVYFEDSDNNKRSIRI